MRLMIQNSLKNNKSIELLFPHLYTKLRETNKKTKIIINYQRIQNSLSNLLTSYSRLSLAVFQTEGI